MAPIKNYKHINAEQKERLLEFMLQHKDLAAGKVSGNKYKQTAEQLYAQLANILNAVKGGSIKDVDGWKKSWTDLKRKSIEKEFYRRKQLTIPNGEEVQMSDMDRIIIEHLVPKERFRTEEVNELEIKEHEISTIKTEPQENEVENNTNEFFFNDFEVDEERNKMNYFSPPSTSEMKRKIDTSVPAYYKKAKINNTDNNLFEEEELEDNNFFIGTEENRNSKKAEEKENYRLQLLRERIELKRKELELKEYIWKKTEEQNERKMKLKMEMQEKLCSCLGRIADELQKQNYL